MENSPDWDLLAVVRSCCSTTTSTATTTISLPDPPLSPPLPPPQTTPYTQQEKCFSTCTNTATTGVFFQFSSNPFDSCCQPQELQDVCNPLTCTTAVAATAATATHNNTNSFQSISSASLASPVSSPSSVITSRNFCVGEQHHQYQQQQQQFDGLIKPSHVIFGASSPIGGSATSNVQRTKKRKNLMKKVCHVPAEGLSSDMWAWRKYGQKPIKGSPYPRGYYRCSSSKGCLARKQVERNRSDPKMFIITYTAEHNHLMPTHRNSLAGSTRQKPLSTTEIPPEQQPSCSSHSAASLSPLKESKSEENEVIKEEDDTNDMVLSDLMLQDNFFVGFEQIDGGSDGSDCFSDQFSPSSEFPWLASNSSASTAGGGS